MSGHLAKLFSLIAVLGVLLSGCSTSTPNAGTTVLNEQPGASGDGSGSSVAEPEADSGTESGASDIFASVPDDIYVAEGHSSVDMVESGGRKNLVLEYPVSEIAAFIEAYHEGMKASGWELVTSSELPIGTLANFSKEDRKCTVSIAPPKEEIIKVAIVMSE